MLKLWVMYVIWYVYCWELVWNYGPHPFFRSSTKGTLDVLI